LHRYLWTPAGGIKCELQAFYALGIENFSSWLQHAIMDEEYM
jgi:hypothetical protein